MPGRQPSLGRSRVAKATPVALGLLAAVAIVYRHVFRGELLAGRDVLRLALPDSAFLLECLRRGELPLWLPNVFLGQPFAATLQSEAFYPPRILAVLAFGPYWGVTILQLAHAFIAALGVYALSRQLKVPRDAAFIAGLAFGLSPLFTEMSGTPNMVGAAAWTGWIAAGAMRVAGPKRWRAVAGVAVAAGLSLLAGSPETTLWQAGIAVALALATGGWRAGALSAVGLGWGAALSGVALVPALEFAAQSPRAETAARALDWSASPAQLVALFWPLADQPRGSYWGPDQWLLVELFLGTTVVVLAAVGIRKSRPALVFAGAAVLLALLALGAHFRPGAWALTPLLWRFRYPAKALVGVAFCIAVLAGIGLRRAGVLLRRVGPSARMVFGVGTLGGLVAVAGALAARGLHLRPGAITGWPWLALAIAALVSTPLAISRRRARGKAIRIALGAIIAAEILTYDVLWAGTARVRADELSRPSELAGLLPRGGAGRISVGQGGGEPAGPTAPIEIPRGLDESAAHSRDGLVPNRFVEDGLYALEGYGAPEPPRIYQFQLAHKRAIYDLAGVTHYVRSGDPPYPDLAPVAGSGGTSVFTSTTAMPRAFVVHTAKVVSDAEALAAVRDDAEPARTTAFLASGEPLAGSCMGSTARIESESANSVRVLAKACGPGYLVLSDAWYPGWVATMDGHEAVIHRADYALRAVRIEAGDHEVVLRYRPWSFRLGALLSALALVLTVAARVFPSQPAE